MPKKLYIFPNKKTIKKLYLALSIINNFSSMKECRAQICKLKVNS